MKDLCRLIWCALIGLFRPRAALEAENLVLRHQLNVLRRKSPKRLAFITTSRWAAKDRGGHSSTHSRYERREPALGSTADPRRTAQAWHRCRADHHPPFDVKGLADYMRGLVAGGPTRSGHRTPSVIVNVPVNGTDEAAVHANAWMFAQVLATGVHGIMLTHADTPGAIRAFVEAVRFPIHKQGLDKGLNEGRRGVHGAFIAAPIWGISPDEYLDRADPWPLNPNGELLLGVKLEDRYALVNADENLK